MTEDNRIKVLVADDGRDNREFIVEYILQPGGFLPLLARDGAEAMDMVRQYHPDIILLDLQMPRMNGLEVLDTLQAEGWDIPVILMTFHGSEEIAIEVFRKGVRDYVKKPYTVDEMEDAMNRCLSEVRLRREKEALTERLLQGNAALNRRIKELNTLYQIGKQVASLAGMDVLLPRVVDAAVQVVRAEQSSVMLFEGDQLVVRAIKLVGDGYARAAREYSADRLARRAALSGHMVLLGPDELGRLQAQNPALPVAVVYVPLKVGDRVLGVLSAEQVSPNAEPFSKQDGAMLSALGDYAAIAIENARMYSQLHTLGGPAVRELRAALERTVAPTVIERLVQAPDAIRLSGERREISVVAVNLHSLIAPPDQGQDSPDALITLLNRAYEVAAQVIFAHEGMMDRCGGDALLALFNAPGDQPDHPVRALETALALQQAIDEYLAGGETAGLTGIAVHVGQAILGSVGTETTAQYTALGPVIGTAQRLQTRAAPGQVLVTDALLARLGDAVRAVPVGDLPATGDQPPVLIYALEWAG